MHDLDPIARTKELLLEASATERFDATRCALATSGRDGRASVRFVLVKEIDDEGFVFFTNYESRKGMEIAQTGWSSLAFHWESLGVQVRAEGATERIDAAASDAYFASRPRGSQIGAWASHQSRELSSRAALMDAVNEVTRRFEGKPIERPSFWGGYRLRPSAIEIWRGHEDRLHERWRYERVAGIWRGAQLQP